MSVNVYMSYQQSSPDLTPKEARNTVNFVMS